MSTRPSALGMSDPVMVLVRLALVYLFLIVVRVEEVTFYGKRGHLVQSVERMEPLYILETPKFISILQFFEEDKGDLVNLVESVYNSNKGLRAGNRT